MIAGLNKSICAVSNSKYMTSGGWAKIKGAANGDVPFRLYHENENTFLQWQGDNDLRKSLEGRLIVVNLLCRNSRNFTDADDVGMSFYNSESGISL